LIIPARPYAPVALLAGGWKRKFDAFPDQRFAREFGGSSRF
jgi:hypothetical protein